MRQGKKQFSGQRFPMTAMQTLDPLIFQFQSVRGANLRCHAVFSLPILQTKLTMALKRLVSGENKPTRKNLSEKTINCVKSSLTSSSWSKSM
ncbi:hypothetical protein E2C01_040847 [Portunus trituberculatus]|uniref:Uncharacterized protein n=1 Tax=Portunus trituberculatus TaxID=210409 RepID=A0A5B7FKV4_PORTR|nr:hypothetical protein [Portunus trituberculatus]